MPLCHVEKLKLIILSCEQLKNSQSICIFPKMGPNNIPPTVECEFALHRKHLYVFCFELLVSVCVYVFCYN